MHYNMTISRITKTTMVGESSKHKNRTNTEEICKYVGKQSKNPWQATTINQARYLYNLNKCEHQYQNE